MDPISSYSPLISFASVVESPPSKFDLSSKNVASIANNIIVNQESLSPRVKIIHSADKQTATELLSADTLENKTSVDPNKFRVFFNGKGLTIEEANARGIAITPKNLIYIREDGKIELNNSLKGQDMEVDEKKYSDQDQIETTDKNNDSFSQDIEEITSEKEAEPQEEEKAEFQKTEHEIISHYRRQAYLGPTDVNVKGAANGNSSEMQQMTIFLMKSLNAQSVEHFHRHQQKEMEKTEQCMKQHMTYLAKEAVKDHIERQEINASIIKHEFLGQ